MKSDCLPPSTKGSLPFFCLGPNIRVFNRTTSASLKRKVVSRVVMDVPSASGVYSPISIRTRICSALTPAKSAVCCGVRNSLTSRSRREQTALACEQGTEARRLRQSHSTADSFCLFSFLVSLLLSTRAEFCSFALKSCGGLCLANQLLWYDPHI